MSFGYHLSSYKENILKASIVFAFRCWSNARISEVTNYMYFHVLK